MHCSQATESNNKKYGSCVTNFAVSVSFICGKCLQFSVIEESLSHLVCYVLQLTEL